MPRSVQTVIVGQGLAGSVMAWTLASVGHEVLIFDPGTQPGTSTAASASRVAAGLVTPLSGKNCVRPPDYDDQWRTACAFYQHVEAQTGADLFEVTPMIRLFRTAEQRDEFLANADERVRQTCKPLDVTLQANQQSGSRAETARTETAPAVAATPAGRLNVARFLDITRSWFADRGQWKQATIDCEKDIVFDTDTVRLPEHNLEAQRVILCTGATATTQFPAVPDNPSRGDILSVSIPGFTAQSPVHHGIWIAPNTDQTQDVGATYDWSNLSDQPSAAGRQELLSRLSRVVAGEVTVHQHRAAVRPTMKDYQPVAGQHPDQQHLFLLNGLGSKGTLRAPTMARLLRDLITDQIALPKAVDIRRLAADAGRTDLSRRPLTQRAQDVVRDRVRHGDLVIDATVGNGFDTCFLADAVGPQGTVIGYDVQEAAVNATRQRLNANGAANVDLRLRSHEYLSELGANTVVAVMFNLGYLPRGDHSVTTKPASTTRAIKAAVKSLMPGGVLTVLCYRGHQGGPEEFVAVELLLSDLAVSERYDLQRIDSTPARPTAPVLFVLRKVQSPDAQCQPDTRLHGS